MACSLHLTRISVYDFLILVVFQERERLAKFFKSCYGLDMLDRELSVKGWNSGVANFNGSVLGFEVGGKADAFEVPLPYVNQCIPGKNEITLEFHSNDDAAVMLTEMRFHIPPSELAGEDPVDAFKEAVMKKASVVVTSGDALAIFREIHCLSPRGRYDIKAFPTYIHLHGKTFDYKIQMASVMRIFLLPHKDQRQEMYLVGEKRGPSGQAGPDALPLPGVQLQAGGRGGDRAAVHRRGAAWGQVRRKAAEGDVGAVVRGRVKSTEGAHREEGEKNKFKI